MATYDDKKGILQDTNGKKREGEMWPVSGSSAIDILKTKHHVLVSVGLFSTIGFQAFYQDWIMNVDPREDKQIYISSIEFKDGINPIIFKGVQMLAYSGCDDYVAFFRYMKNMGTWIFLAENESKMDSIINASREAGTYVRVYGLSRDGKIRNFTVPKRIQTYDLQRHKLTNDSFLLPKEITPIKRVTRKGQYTPGQGDFIYDSSGEAIELREEVFSNPQSITYKTNKSGIQAKVYQNSWLTISYFEDKAKKMLEKSLNCEGICWPLDLLYNEGHEFVGILVPAAEGYQLKQDLMSQQGLEKNFPNWSRRDLTHLAKIILDKIVYLQDRNILFGVINPSAIFVKDKDHVYFAEMDTYQIEGYPVMSREKVMQAPELQDIGDGMRLYTKKEDNYEIALLVFMILMPGKFPYNKGKNKTVSESIKKMSFAFRYGKQGEEHGAREYFGLWRFVWSHLGAELKQAFYSTFQFRQAFSLPEKRRDARFWQKEVGKLEQELIDPYDEESLRIFPRTFKRFRGTKTIQCVKCGIRHPDFYYRYPEKQICNSCLGKPSETHFVCRSCGKAFYYDFGTLFKYEKLVETKGFSMPTHCPYCRSDKQKCRCCGEMVPAYKLNKDGICIDCVKRAKERIARRYIGKCGHEIVLTQGEVDFWMKKFGKLPPRCKQCREKRRNGS